MRPSVSIYASLARLQRYMPMVCSMPGPLSSCWQNVSISILQLDKYTYHDVGYASKLEGSLRELRFLQRLETIVRIVNAVSFGHVGACVSCVGPMSRADIVYTAVSAMAMPARMSGASHLRKPSSCAADRPATHRRQACSMYRSRTWAAKSWMIDCSVACASPRATGHQVRHRL